LEFEKRIEVRKFLFTLTLSSALLSLHAEDLSEEDLTPEEEPALFEQHPGEKKEYIPWLTGPILAPPAYVITLGHFQMKASVFATKFSGRYDNQWHLHSTPYFLAINPVLNLKAGLSKNVDLTITPQVFYNHVDGASTTGFADLPVELGVQLYRYKDDSDWLPAIKLILIELFPTGKYQKLNPNKKKTDAFGGGSFSTSAGLSFGRLFHFKRHHFLNTRFAFVYQLQAPVHVKGFNSYGGAADTHGKVFPPQTYALFLALEYSLNQRWVVALDARYIHTNKTRFSGHPGHSAPGIKANMTAPSSEQFVLAPEIEYNWSNRIGIIAGPWGTIAGRNTSRFYGAIILFRYYV
jgi:hypothetical protein